MPMGRWEVGAGQSVKIAGQFSWRMPSRAERAQHETQPALKLCSLTKPQHHKSARTCMHEEVVLEICVFNDAHVSVGHVGVGGVHRSLPRPEVLGPLEMPLQAVVSHLM